MLVELARVVKIGRALYINLPAKVARECVLNAGDRVAVRIAGEKLVLERVQMEKLAVLRTGEAHI